MTPDSPGGGELTVLDYLRPVWRFRFAVVAIVVLAAAATYIYTNREARVYETSTNLYVGQSQLQQIINPAVILSSRSVADEASLLTTPAVAEEVVRRLKLPYSPLDLLGAVQAVPSATEDFLTIAAQAGNPQLAARIANGFAQAFITLRNRDLVQSAKTALSQAQAQLARTPGGAANLAGRTSLEQEIATLQAEVVSPPSQGEQVNPAPIPVSAISPTPRRDAIFAAVIAFVLAIIGAYLVDRTDRRVRRVEDVETLFDLPVLATIPHVRGIGRKSSHARTPHAAQEPHRTLRMNLDIARAAVDGRVIMITSALPSEGKSTIVRNLALSYRESGASVAVVEADMRRPVLADQFELPHGTGLAEALSEGEPLRTYKVPDSEHEPPTRGRIDVALAGASVENPSVLLGRSHLPAILRRMAQRHDIVLVDSPPLLSVSDGLALLNAVDGVLVVVRTGRTTYPAAQRLRRTIERIGAAPILGVVANGAADNLAAYGYQYYDRPMAGEGRPVANGTVDHVHAAGDDVPAV